jgi:hypothetical protein
MTDTRPGASAASSVQAVRHWPSGRLTAFAQEDRCVAFWCLSHSVELQRLIAETIDPDLTYFDLDIREPVPIAYNRLMRRFLAECVSVEYVESRRLLQDGQVPELLSMLDECFRTTNRTHGIHVKLMADIAHPHCIDSMCRIMSNRCVATLTLVADSRQLPVLIPVIAGNPGIISLDLNLDIVHDDETMPHLCDFIHRTTTLKHLSLRFSRGKGALNGVMTALRLNKSITHLCLAIPLYDIVADGTFAMFMANNTCLRKLELTWLRTDRRLFADLCLICDTLALNANIGEFRITYNVDLAHNDLPRLIREYARVLVANRSLRVFGLSAVNWDRIDAASLDPFIAVVQNNHVIEWLDIKVCNNAADERSIKQHLVDAYRAQLVAPAGTNLIGIGTLPSAFPDMDQRAKTRVAQEEIATFLLADHRRLRLGFNHTPAGRAFERWDMDRDKLIAIASMLLGNDDTGVGGWAWKRVEKRRSD